MKDPATKSELLRAMRDARDAWDALIAQVPRERMEEPGAAGTWSVKDVVAHVTEYDRWLALGLAMRLQQPPQIWLDDLSLNEFNAALHEQIRNRALGEVLADSEHVFRELIEEVEAQSETYLFGTHHVQGVPYAVIPSEILRSESYGHYADHTPGLRAWLSGLSTPPG
jgi:hypothetical protein